MKTEFEINTELCQQMMFWRKVNLFAAVPFAWTLLFSFYDGRLVSVDPRASFLLAFAYLLQPLLLFHLFRLVCKMHGQVSASLHVGLTVVLTPFFLIGPLFIPLLVLGDARRLLLDQDSKK